VGELNALLAGEQAQLFVVHDAFPNQWERFLAPTEDAVEQALTLPLERKHFPYFAQRQGFGITKVEFALLLDDSVVSPDPENLTLTLGGDQAVVVLSKASDGSYMVGGSGALAPVQQPGTWTLTRAKGQDPAQGDLDYPGGWVDRTKVTGMLMIVRYTLDA
jgi:hypothetical protein